MAKDILITPGSARIDFSGTNDQVLYLSVDDDGTLVFNKSSDDTQVVSIDGNGLLSVNSSLQTDLDLVLSRNDGTAPAINISNFDNFRLISSLGSSTIGVNGSNRATANGSPILTEAQEGSGNGLDADTVDGVEASQFIRSDESDNMTGVLTISTNVSSSLVIDRTTDNDATIHFSTTTKDAFLGVLADGQLAIHTASDVIDSGSRILTTADEGSGNGLDADTVDGVHLAGLVQTSRTITAGNGLSGGGDLTTNRTLALDYNELATAATTASDLISFADVTDTNIVKKRTVSDFISDHDILTGTEGSGNSFDADTVDGLEAAQFLRSDAADTASEKITFGSDAQVDGELLLANGSVGSPSLTFTSDTDSGFYQIAADTIGVAAGGAIVGRFSSTGVGLINGTESSPSLAFISDVDTGLFLSGTNSLSASAGGNEVVRFLSEASSVNYLTATASATGNSIALEAAGTDDNVGIDLSTKGTGSFVVSVDSSTALTVSSTSVQSELPVLTSNGSAGNPSFSFSNDTNTGFYSLGADQIGVSLGGNAAFGITSTDFYSANANGPSIKNASGSATVPTILPNRARSDVGIASPASGELTIVAGGAESARFLTEASAVNYLGIRGSATGEPVQIEAAGTDSHIGVALESKGSNGYVTNVVDGNEKFTSLSSYNQSLVPVYSVDGSATAPSYSFTSDVNTGIYRIGENILGFSTNGTNQVSIDNAGMIIADTDRNGGSEILSVKGDAGLRLRDSSDLHGLEGLFSTDTWYFGTDSDVDLVLRRNGSNSIVIETSAVKTQVPLKSSASGNASGPDYSFDGDDDSGMYRVGADSIGFSVGGSAALQLSSVSATFSSVILGVDGSAGSPAYSFTSDPNSGIYSVSADVVGVSTGGTQRVFIDSTGLSVTNASGAKLINSTASSTVPTVVPNRGDVDTGIGSSGDNTLSLITGGTEGARLTSDNRFRISDGSVSSPAIGFISDALTGIYKIDTSNIGIAVGGANAIDISSSAITMASEIRGINGSNGSPAFTFTSDQDTGMYRVGADQLGFAAGGTLSLQINDGEVIIPGNLTVSGTTTTVNTTEVNIADNIFVLNSDVTGSPTEDSGFEIERGTSTNARLVWDETNDRWEAGLAGSETQIAIFDSNGDLDAERDLHVKNENEVHFGGTGAANTDSKFTIAYNSTSESLDFTFVG
jgi:hypothetical protein